MDKKVLISRIRQVTTGPQREGQCHEKSRLLRERLISESSVKREAFDPGRSGQCPCRKSKKR
jgi:hypothetical protein